MQEVVETDVFASQAAKLLTDSERLAVIDFLAYNPEAGDLIPATGGVRKVRVPLQNKGKSGGARVIYYVYSDNAPIYALLVYAKSKQTDMTATDKKAVRAFAEAIKSAERT